MERAAVGLAVVPEEGEPLRDADRPVEGNAAAAPAPPPRRQGADLLERRGRGELQLPSADGHPPPRESPTWGPRREGFGEGEDLRLRLLEGRRAHADVAAREAAAPPLPHRARWLACPDWPTNGTGARGSALDGRQANDRGRHASSAHQRWQAPRSATARREGIF